MHRLQELLRLEPKKDAGKASYKALLEATESLFVSKGIQNVAIADIVKKAGVGNQTLYNYFPKAKSDLALMLYYYRRRRVKHAIRGAVNHLGILLQLPILQGRAPIQIPAYFAARLIIHAMFKVWREKPELDRELLLFMPEHSSPCMTLQSELAMDDVARAVSIVTNLAPSDMRVVRLSIMITFGIKGIMDYAHMRYTPDMLVSQDAEESFARMVGVMLAHTMGDDYCSGCAAVTSTAARIDNFWRSTIESAPITSTVPTQPVDVDKLELMLQELQLTCDRGGKLDPRRAPATTPAGQ